MAKKLGRPNPIVVTNTNLNYYQLRHSSGKPYTKSNPYTVYTIKRESGSSVPPLGLCSGAVSHFLTSSIVQAADNKARIDTKDKIANVALILEDIATARSTVALLQERLFKLARFTKTLKKSLAYNIKVSAGVKKRSPKHDERELSTVPAAWLEWNFVYKPTVGSVNDLISHMLDPEVFRRVVYAGGAMEFGGTLNKGTNLEQHCFGRTVVRYNGAVEVDNINHHLAATSGLYSLAETAWALVPWSWAVDYLVDVSSWLGQLDNRFAGLKFSNWTRSIKTEAIVSGRYPAPGTALGYYIYTMSYESYQRSLIPGPPESIDLQWNPDLNVKRLSYLASATALTLQGKFNGRFPSRERPRRRRSRI